MARMTKAELVADFRSLEAKLAKEVSDHGHTFALLQDAERKLAGKAAKAASRPPWLRYATPAALGLLAVVAVAVVGFLAVHHLANGQWVGGCTRVL